VLARLAGLTRLARFPLFARLTRLARRLLWPRFAHRRGCAFIDQRRVRDHFDDIGDIGSALDRRARLLVSGRMTVGAISAAATTAPTATAAPFLAISNGGLRHRHTGCNDRRVDGLGNQCGFVARFTWLTRLARPLRVTRFARLTRLALWRAIGVAPLFAAALALWLSRALLRLTALAVGTSFAAIVAARVTATS